MRRLARSILVRARIRRAGLFEPAFYLGQLAGRADERQARRNPLQHYLQIGGFEGLDPCANFDSDWYLQAYPDVKALGLNPLVHYLGHGMAEGRLPCHGARPVEPAVDAGAIAKLERQLWGGFEHLALAQLRRQAVGRGGSQAAWCLAAWEYGHGQMTEALKWLQVAIGEKKRRFSARELISFAKCYTHLGDFSALTSLLEDYYQQCSVVLSKEEAVYLEANAQGDDDKRLALINSLLEPEGLGPVECKDSIRPLGLDNLSASAPSADVPNPPLVTVVVPAYNAAATLSIALDSLLGQSWQNLEVLVVDDSSTDKTAELIQDYTKRDKRVRYIASVQNNGAYSARNLGMQAARGEFVTVHDSDDWSHPQKIERQLAPLLVNEDKVASVSSWVRVSPDLRFVGSWLLGEHFLETNYSSWLIRNVVLNAIGLWDTVNVAADTEFLWRLEHHFGHQALVQVLPGTPLAFALSDESTLTRTKATHVKTVFYGLRRLYWEASRWWHRVSAGKPVMKGRPFPVPLGTLKRPSLEFDVLLAADFAIEGKPLAELLELLERQVGQGKRLCLLHWPDYKGWLGRPIADEVFAFCQHHGINFAHSGLTLTVPEVLLADEGLWRFPPTETVRAPGLERVVGLDGESFGDEIGLLEYFRRGGVQV